MAPYEKPLISHKVKACLRTGFFLYEKQKNAPARVRFLCGQRLAAFNLGKHISCDHIAAQLPLRQTGFQPRLL
jgi:hypothetical protein